MKKVIFMWLFMILLFLSACVGIPDISGESTSQDDKNMEYNSLSENSILENNSSLAESTYGKVGEQSTERISDMEMLKSLNQDGWYYYFEDNTGKQFYYMEFNTSKHEMSWNIGYFESEYVNTFKGPFDVDENGVFHGDLFDDLRNTGIKVTFTIETSAGSFSDENGNEIIITVMSSNLDKYKYIVKQPLTFTSEKSNPYLSSTAEFTVQQQVGSQNIIVTVSADKALTQKDNVLFDDVNERRFQFNALENSTEDKYFIALNDGTIKYVKDETLGGKTTLEYLYSVYYSDVELRQGQSVRYYKIFVMIDDTISIIVDADYYLFRDAGDYYEHDILPVIQSINIQKK